MKGRILPLLCTLISAFHDPILVGATVPDDSTFSVEVPKENINFHGSAKTGHDIVKRDIARVQTLFGGRPKESSTLPANDPNGNPFGIIMDIQVGEGSYSVLVDTGSSDSWIGANMSHPYLPSDHSLDIGKDFNVSYGSGNVTGRLFSDFMKLPGVPQFRQIFGVANASNGFDGTDGLLGIGPQLLTLKSVRPNENIPTPTDNMLVDHIINRNLTALFIPPLVTNMSGRIDFGGINTEGLTTPINYVPNLDPMTSDLSRFYSINETIRYGEGENGIVLFDGGAIMDYGTTLLAMSAPAFQKYTQVTGAVLDNATGLLRVNDTTQLKSMFFQIGDIQYEFTPDAQTLPKEFNTDAGGVPNATYLIASGLPPVSFTPDFVINGLYWLQHYYVAFDSSYQGRRVGIAETEFTFSRIK